MTTWVWQAVEDVLKDVDLEDRNNITPEVLNHSHDSIESTLMLHMAGIRWLSL